MITLTRKSFLLGAATSMTIAITPAVFADNSTQATTGAQMSSSLIKGPRGRLALFQSGNANGMPLLFLHADPGRASQWTEVMAAMAKSHPVAAFDFRGAGDSSAPENGDYSYDGRAEDVSAVADVLGLKRFVIVAHSGGAAVALSYSKSHGNKVAGILMIDPVTDPRALPQAVRDGLVKDTAGPKGREIWRAYVGSIAGKNEAVRERVLADAEKRSNAAIAGLSAVLATWNPEITLFDYKGPIHILSTPATDTPAALYRLRPDITHEVVQTDGHWLQLDHTDIVAKAVDNFMTHIDKQKAAP
jgi:pimeloyl-ACP methyl ester carboxylesterase